MTVEIPRGEWAEFCRQFSRLHRGWLVCVIELPGEAADQDALDHPAATVLARDLPLREVSAAAGRAGARVVAGDEDGHLLEDARRLVLEQTEAGAHRGLRLDGERATVLIRFRSPVAPESVDGLG